MEAAGSPETWVNIHYIIQHHTTDDNNHHSHLWWLSQISYSWDFKFSCCQWELGQCSRHSDWLWAVQPRGWSLSPGGGKNFHYSMSSKPALGSNQPPIQWVSGILSSGVKQQGCEADRSRPTSDGIKKTWVYTSTPPYIFMAQCLISYVQGQVYLLPVDSEHQCSSMKS
jgi:hypothetical protein